MQVLQRARGHCDLGLTFAAQKGLGAGAGELLRSALWRMHVSTTLPHPHPSRRVMRRFFLDRAAAEAAALGGPLRPGARTVADVGCGSGAVSLFAAAHGRRALCFEPDPEALPLLEAGLRANNDTGHLVWIQVPQALRGLALCRRGFGQWQGSEARGGLHRRAGRGS